MKQQVKQWWQQASGLLLPVLHRYRAVLIVLLAGILLLGSGGWFGGAQPEENAPVQQEEEFALQAFEQKLQERLGAIEGAGRVQLMLSLEQTGESVYAVDARQNTNSDSSRSYESSLAVVSDGSYGEKPITVKNLLPTFRGAVILCEGADDAQVRLAVTRAVGTVCGLGADKITVLKMKAEA
ncbi:hypothetical protein [Agathobaculum desmolans]|uniref:hypothetical protein n=1 Tax=Agathobaculum desmolans TaxID=39484 RepID=UPI0004E26CF7|nr:hypothetical protein [Agathobaculum desmolans]